MLLSKRAKVVRLTVVIGLDVRASDQNSCCPAEVVVGGFGAGDGYGKGGDPDPTLSPTPPMKL